MKTDLLAGIRCPGCGISALHCEGPAERFSVDEVLMQDRFGESLRVTRCWVQCSICGHVWPVATCADLLDNKQLAAWLRHHPVQQLPRDCPR
jgi:hypothetical protein